MMGKLTNSQSHNLRNAERLTERNKGGGITVRDSAVALKRLTDYEDRLERAEKIMPLADIERVLRDGEWLDKIYWVYAAYDDTPPDWVLELKRAADAVLELVEKCPHR